MAVIFLPQRKREKEMAQREKDRGATDFEL
jgi:hypothetical protein